MRVIIALEPTHDGDDIYPAWLAKGREWAQELEFRMDAPVQLEVTDEAVLEEFAAVYGVVVVELSWRDPSLQF